MGVTEDMADELAQLVLEQEKRLDDETIVANISETLGATSTTLQEAFMTSVRVRRAEGRARKMLEEIAKRSP